MIIHQPIWGLYFLHLFFLALESGHGHFVWTGLLQAKYPTSSSSRIRTGEVLDGEQTDPSGVDKGCGERWGVRAAAHGVGTVACMGAELQWAGSGEPWGELTGREVPMREAEVEWAASGRQWCWMCMLSPYVLRGLFRDRSWALMPLENPHSTELSAWWAREKMPTDSCWLVYHGSIMYI